MGLALLIGVVLVIAGAALDQVWIGAVGALFCVAAPGGLLIPILRNTASRPSHARAQNFVGGTLTILGFSPSEQEAAARDASTMPEQQAAHDDETE